MKRIASVSLCLTALLAPAGRAKDDKSAEQTLLKIEQEWSEADLRRDPAALDRILADDWIGIDFEGTLLTKPEALRGIASGSGSLQSTALRDMKVRIYGNTAVITGTDTEKGEYHGQDSSGKYLWTDVFVKKNGRWQAVSSQSTKLAREPGPRQLARR